MQHAHPFTTSAFNDGKTSEERPNQGKREKDLGEGVG